LIKMKGFEPIFPRLAPCQLRYILIRIFVLYQNINW